MGSKNNVTHAHNNDKLVNIASMMAKLGNICFGSKICVREAKTFLAIG